MSRTWRSFVCLGVEKKLSGLDSFMYGYYPFATFDSVQAPRRLIYFNEPSLEFANAL